MWKANYDSEYDINYYTCVEVGKEPNHFTSAKTWYVEYTTYTYRHYVPLF